MVIRPAFVAVFLTVLAFPAAHAAVRQCAAIVSSEIAAAPTELDAKKKALDQWRAKALKLGQGFASWRLASDKSLKCFPNGAAFECVAIGAPCIVDQTPRSPPKIPGDKGQGI